MAVTPRTTKRIVIDPPQPEGGEEQTMDSVANESGGGYCLRLPRMPSETAQQLLDELAARLKAGTIRVSPLVYLVGLIKRADTGKFVPEAALRIADAREWRRRHDAALHRLEIHNKEVILNQTEADSSPLSLRLDEIRKRARDRGKA